MEKSGLPAIRGTPAFHYGKRSRENQECQCASGRGRSTELICSKLLMCGPCGIIIDRLVFARQCIPSLAVVQYRFDAANRTVPQHHQDNDRLAYT
jgi:hypothetical protein